MVLFEASKEAWAAKYFEGREIPISRAIALGKAVAEALEADEATGDFHTDLTLSKFPKLPVRDKSVNVEIVVGKERVPILIKPDAAAEDYSEVGEYKTGTVEWDQRKVDRDEQLTFYATGAYILRKKTPKLWLAWAPTVADEYGRLSLTGEVKIFPTVRHHGQILNMMQRMRKVWAEQGQFCEERML